MRVLAAAVLVGIIGCSKSPPTADERISVPVATAAPGALLDDPSTTHAPPSALSDFPSTASSSAEEIRKTVASSFAGNTAGEEKELFPEVTFHWCPAGEFTMGSPESELDKQAIRPDDEDQVEVVLTFGFWLQETEVSQGQWESLMETAPWKLWKKTKEGADYAASGMSHPQATAYCEKLTMREHQAGRLPSDWSFALPTEAQWEYACRAGTTTAYSFGDDASRLFEYSWSGEIAFLTRQTYPQIIGQKKPNAWGLKDMHGNVSEWCADRYAKRLPGGRNPTGPATGRDRVERGGTFLGFATFHRSASRAYNSNTYGDYVRGFRVAAVPSDD